MAGPQPNFGQQWARGPGRPPAVVVVRTPRRLFGSGVRLVGCRAYTWNGSVIYDFFVVDGTGRVLPFRAAGGRGMARVWVGGRWEYVHRLVAYNTSGVHQGWVYGNPQRRRWRGTEVHHRFDPMRPRQPPWVNSKRNNMVRGGETYTPPTGNRPQLVCLGPRVRL